MQAPDLSPVLHVQHPLPPNLDTEVRIGQGVNFRLPPRGQFSRAVDKNWVVVSQNLDTSRRRPLVTLGAVKVGESTSSR
jgi:hypothetical protein